MIFWNTFLSFQSVVVNEKVTRQEQLICLCPHDVTRPVILPSSPSAGAPSGACAKPQLFVCNILLIKPGQWTLPQRGVL